MKIIGLIDCNSFYASCERVFRPDLINRPIAVLSNNDGCVVAMSSELKQLGVRRGAPYYSVRDQLDRYQAAVFSSNYTLYQDLSDRVMEIIRSFGDPIEVYSIDEAFLYTSGDEESLLLLGKQIRDSVIQQTGIPVSVGFARTKTLAKIANRYAKRHSGVFYLQESGELQMLRNTNLLDVWGIGTRKARFLFTKGVMTAFDLMQCEDRWIRKYLSLVTLKTVWELRGDQAIERELFRPKRKGVLSSLGFSEEITDVYSLEVALASYAAIAVRKLQEQGSEAMSLTVFLQTHRYKHSYYGNSIDVRLSRATAYLPDIIGPAVQGLHAIFLEGLSYTKVGIYLHGIDEADQFQMDLFDQNREKKRRAARAVYEIQQQYGRGSITCRNSLPQESWRMKRHMLSSKYTTSWKELPPVS